MGTASLAMSYLAGGACVVLACVTDTIIQTPVRTSWGWTFEPGPLHPVFYTLTILCVAAGFTLLQRSFRAGVWEGERRQRPLILAGMFVPASLASVTDVFLPWSGIQVPRLGAISFSVLGVLAVVNVVKFGHSMISAGSFSAEILANLGQGVALLNRSGRIRRANEQLARLAERPLAELEGLPIAEFVTSGLPQSLEEVEEHAIRLALRHTGGKKGEAAQLLGIAWPTLRRKLRKYKIDPKSP